MRQTNWDILNLCLVFCHEGWLWSCGWSGDTCGERPKALTVNETTWTRALLVNTIFSHSTRGHASIHALIQGLHSSTQTRAPPPVQPQRCKIFTFCVFKSSVSSSCGSAAGEQMISDNAARSAHLDRLFLSPCQISGLVCQIPVSKWEFLTAIQGQEGRHTPMCLHPENKQQRAYS